MIGSVKIAPSWRLTAALTCDGASARTEATPFTNVLTSVGPQNLVKTNFPIGPDTYDWVNGFGRRGFAPIDFAQTSATWDYRLTFGVERVAVPEPGMLALFGFGLSLVALFTARTRRLERSRNQLKAADCRSSRASFPG